MHFHLAAKDINRYPEDSLSWPFVRYGDFLSCRHVYGKGSKAEMWGGPVNASPADSWGAGRGIQWFTEKRDISHCCMQLVSRVVRGESACHHGRK